MYDDVKHNVKVSGGKFWMENELVDRYLSIISGNELKVLIAITRHYNKNGKCFPSIRRMAPLLNLNPDTISTCLKSLQLKGFFEQLVIRERCKLRYSYTKTAQKLLVDPNFLPDKFRSKEDIKEVLKEDLTLTIKRTPEEQVKINQSLADLRSNYGTWPK